MNSLYLHLLRLHTMASIRAAAAPMLSRSIRRLPRRTTTKRPFYLGPQPSSQRNIRPAFAPVRWHSAPATNSKVYEFNEVKQMIDQPSPDRIIIGEHVPRDSNSTLLNSYKMSANPQNSRTATFPEQSTSQSSRNQTLYSYPRKSSKIVSALKSHPQRKRLSFIADLASGVVRQHN